MRNYEIIFIVRPDVTEEEVDKIIDMTLEYYDQHAVLAYRVSDLVILKHRAPKKGKRNG